MTGTQKTFIIEEYVLLIYDAASLGRLLEGS